MLTRSWLLADSICRLRPALAESRFSASSPCNYRVVFGGGGAVAAAVAVAAAAAGGAAAVVAVAFVVVVVSCCVCRRGGWSDFRAVLC